MSYGNASDNRVGRLQDVPLITIGGDSQLVLPVFEGSAGWAAAHPALPTEAFPPLEPNASLAHLASELDGRS